MSWLRFFERVHGHLGWLTVAALLHPAIVLRNPKRSARLAVLSSTLVTVITAALGAGIYPEYRARIKQSLFIHHPNMGWMFERKEHLAVSAVIFAIVGCVLHFALPTFTDERARIQMARIAHRAFVISAFLAIATASIGLIVASYQSF